jgi:hypothetical protein
MSAETGSPDGYIATPQQIAGTRHQRRGAQVAALTELGAERVLGRRSRRRSRARNDARRVRRSGKATDVERSGQHLDCQYAERRGARQAERAERPAPFPEMPDRGACDSTAVTETFDKIGTTIPRRVAVLLAGVLFARL